MVNFVGATGRFFVLALVDDDVDQHILRDDEEGSFFLCVGIFAC